jgi:D-beta-D-heptose 7-phosphate kinase/D-beta-D-heptose 1-phosphate adenosyltransferase
VPTPPASSADAERLLARHLAAFSGVTVLVLGDAMLDRYVHGEVRRISPEAPIPVLRARARRAVLGGAGNVAENAAALGARAILVGLVGDDPAGQEIAAALQGRIGDGLVRVPGRPTTRPRCSPPSAPPCPRPAWSCCPTTTRAC